MIASLNHNTAIILFSRSVEAEAREKKFIESVGKKIQKRIASTFINHTKSICQKSELTFFISDEKSQRGSNFGERMSFAIEDVFEKGFENVIVIGNDCPTISTSDIYSAALSLSTGNSVIGPASDGGVYLFGINRKNFSKEKFTNLTWQTSNLGLSLENYLKQENSRIDYLKEKSDVDNLLFIKISEIKRIKISIARLLISILSSFSQKKYTEDLLILNPVFLTIPKFRGPPTF